MFSEGHISFTLSGPSEAFLAPALEPVDERQGQLTGNIELILCPSVPLRLFQLTALKNGKSAFPFLYS